MDWGELIWNTSQDFRIGEVSEQVAQFQRDRDLNGYDPRALSAENVELKLRLGLLVRLLIDKGLITAAEYAEMISATRPNSSAE